MKKLVLLAGTVLAVSLMAGNTSGEAIFAKKCKSCHGPKAEKKALNKSQVIAGWDEKKTLEALMGYQKGTYGGSMKGIMKGKVKGYSKEELEAIAKYIASLKAK